LEFDAIFYNLLLTFIHPNLYFKKYYKNTQYNCRYQSGQGLDKYKNIYSIPYKIFFSTNKRDNKNQEIIERQNSFLEMEIDTCFSDRKYMNVLFAIIATFEIERRIQFFELFLKKNKEVNNFKKIRLKSQKLDGLIDVKKKKYMLIEEKDFYQTIVDLPVCDAIDYLEHKQYLQNEINNLEREIQEEEIKGFIDNY